MNFQEVMRENGVRVLRDDYVQWRMCRRKRRYDTELIAKNAMARTPEGESPLNTYYCEHCFGWHVGHVPQKG